MTERSTHKKSGYLNWVAMKNRCYYSKHSNYPNYGGKGIKVCDEWKDDFNQFMTDMGPKPTPLHTIERICSKSDYSPTNCIWATRKEQANNRSSNVLLELDGITLTAKEWSIKLGITLSTIYSRVKAGLPDNEVLSTTKRQSESYEVVTFNTTTRVLNIFPNVKSMVRATGGAESTWRKRLSQERHGPFNDLVVTAYNEKGREILDSFIKVHLS